MIDLVRAELLKVRTTRGWYVYLGLIVLLVGLGVSGDIGTAEDFVRSGVEFQRGLVEGAGFALLLALILAITVATTEFRHGTITPTLLTTPRREIVVVAKAIAAILVAIGFALLAFLTLAVVGSIWLAAVGADNQLADPEVLGAAAKLLLAAPIWALVGVAVGVLVQSQVAALVGTLIWIFLAETIIVALLELLDVGGLADYLPFQALDAADGTNTDLLPYWTAVGVSLAWALVLGAAAKLLLAAPIWALVGVAVGVLVQSQVAALVGALIWIFLAETIIVALLELLDVGSLTDYLPFQALDAADGTNTDLLPYWTAVGVSLAWALVLGAAGTERLRRRDIT